MKLKMRHYVMGFCFDPVGENVALILKDKPARMAGNWNGIGGHIEEGETPLAAMRREWKEETGHKLLGWASNNDWTHTITDVCPGGTIYVFCAFATDITEIRSVTREEVGIHPVDDLPKNMMNNLKWMIPLQQADIVWPLCFHQTDISHGG